MAGNIALYRCGINELYLSQYSWIYEQLEGVRPNLEAIGMYDRCQDALVKVEALVREGPERDEEAESLLLMVIGELTQASGSLEKLQRRFRAQNDSTPSE